MAKHEALLEALLEEIELVHARLDEIEPLLVRVRESIDAQRSDQNWAFLHIFRKLSIKVTRHKEVPMSEALYEQAKAAVREVQSCSTSFLQRRLGIGYARAAQLVDLLEERGVIGPENGAKPRMVVGS